MHNYLARPNPSANALNTRSFSARDLAEIYNFPQPITQRAHIVIISFGGSLFGTLNPDGTLTNGDVQSYWNSLGLQNFPTVRVMFLGGKIAPESDSNSTTENSLDVEIAGAICPNSDITLIVAAGVNDAFMKVFQTALALKPTVVSCSWGLPESSAGPQFATAIDGIFQQFVALGITICVASGDAGAQDKTSNLCADFPACSPNVLAVGGTTLMCNTNVYDATTSETVWNNNPLSSATGAGVSRIFAKPTYQQSLPGTHRMEPDVCLCADPQTGYVIIVNGRQEVIGGTSGAAPLMAGFLARIGCNRFATPLLYSAPLTCFHDITVGNNGGYAAGRGYDIVSGLGSINGLQLQQSLMAALPVSPPLQLVPILRVGSLLSLGVTSSSKVSLSSSAPTIASIDSGGVRALQKGFAVITAQTVVGEHTSLNILVV